MGLSLAPLGCQATELSAATAPKSASAPVTCIDAGATLRLQSAAAGALGLRAELAQVRSLRTRRLVGGRLVPIDTQVAHVFAPVAGRVESLDAPVGAQVKRGDLLARIVSPDVAAAASDVRRTRAELEVAKKSLARQRALSKLGATSLQEVEGARDRLQVAVAEEERAGAMASLLGAGRRAPAKAVGGDGDGDGIQGEAGRLLRLTSPIAGEVIARGSNLGVTLQGAYDGGLGPELFTIADLRRIWLEIDLHIGDVGDVRVGAAVEVWPLADAPQEAPLATGHLSWVSKTLDPNTRTGIAHMEIDNPTGALHPFAPVRAYVAVAGSPRLSVPRRAVAQVGGKTVVWVAQVPGDGAAGEGASGGWQLIRRPLQVDLGEPGDHVEVLFGLKPGEQVVSGEAADWSARLLAACP